MNHPPKSNKRTAAQMIRMPAEMHRVIKTMAETEHRSVNQQVVFLLERAVENQDRA